jgi:hypothetical protein
MSDDCDPIIEADDDGVILADGDGEIRCPNGHEFDRDEAASATFDGTTARYQCPSCGAWTDGPPPG